MKILVERFSYFENDKETEREVDEKIYKLKDKILDITFNHIPLLVKDKDNNTYQLVKIYVTITYKK